MPTANINEFITSLINDNNINNIDELIAYFDHRVEHVEENTAGKISSEDELDARNMQSRDEHSIGKRISNYAKEQNVDLNDINTLNTIIKLLAKQERD